MIDLTKPLRKTNSPESINPLIFNIPKWLDKLENPTPYV